jgi:hypothetical protein
VTSPLHFEITPRDLEAFASHHAAEAPHLVGRIRRMRLVWAGVFGLIAWEYSKTSVSGALGFLVVGAAYLAAYGPLNRFLYVRQNRNLNNGPDAPRLGPVTLRFEAGRLEVEATQGSSTLQPSAIRRVTESPTHYFLYLGPTSAIIVPKTGVTGGDPGAFVRAVRVAANV